MSSPADFQKHEKSQKICLKTPVKSSCIFNANFIDFCLHFGSQNPSKKLSPLNIFSTFSPRHVQDAPRRLQDTSGQPKDTSKLPQVALKHPKNATKLKVLKNPRILSGFHPIFLHFSCFQASHGEEKGRPL